MRFFSGSRRPCKLATRRISGLVFFALLLTASVVFTSKALAQDAGNAPQATPEPLPPPAVFRDRISSDQLAFLNDYAGKTTKEVEKDKRLRSVMKKVIPNTIYHYGRDMSLSVASEDVMDGTPLPVSLRDGRYLMVATSGGLYLAGRGFLWFDLKEGIVLGGVYFHPINGEPTPTLAIFSRQLQDTSLSMSQLPLAFAEDLSQWIQTAKLRYVFPRYFIPANGKKYVLLHDEDYCDHPAEAPAPPQDSCQQLNAEAAEADLNAADFVAQTHNAANATAWMLSPEQVAWIGVRNQSCGIGPNQINCRIRLTRQRTRVVLAQRRR
jgi:uncharacterized protein YecT (DUF1311 family)